MAWNARKAMVYPSDFEMYRTRHVAGLCLLLFVVTVIGSTATRVWSQENVTTEEKTDSTNKQVAEVDPASDRDRVSCPSPKHSR